MVEIQTVFHGKGKSAFLPGMATEYVGLGATQINIQVSMNMVT